MAPHVFPYWFQPRKDVGAILCTSQEELDALVASGWPDKFVGSADPVEPEPGESEPVKAAPVKRGPGRPAKT